MDGGPGSGRTVGVRRPSAVGAAATRARQPVVSPSLTPLPAHGRQRLGAACDGSEHSFPDEDGF